MTKLPRPIFKPQALTHSENHDDSLSDSPPQISNITDNFSTTSSNSAIPAAGDLDEAESNRPTVSLLLENSPDQSGLLEFEAATDASASVALASYDEEIVESGGCSAEEVEVLTELSEVAAQSEARIIMDKCSEKDEGEGNLVAVLAGFSAAMEKLCDAIREVLLPSAEQKRRRSRNDGVFFFLVKLGEMLMIFLIGSVLVFFLLILVAPEVYPTLNSLSEFNGPTPT